MKKQKIILGLFVSLLVFSSIFTSVKPSFAQTENEFFISELDCSAFPTITMLVRGLDSGGNLISPELLINNFALYENGQLLQNIQPGVADEGPKYVIFSLDMGQNSNLADFTTDIQDVMRTFANDYFKEGKDTVEIVLHTNPGRPTQEVMGPYNVLTDFETAIDDLSLSRSPNALEGLSGLREVYDTLSGLNPGRYSMVIIHFSRLVEGITPSQAVEQGTSLGAQMASKNIRVYVLNTDKSGALNVAPPFQALTLESGGDYFPSTTPPFQDSDLSRLFNTIKQNSQSYRVQFQAQALNAEYRIAPPGIAAAEATDFQSCTDVVSPPAPEIQILQPTGVNPSAFLQAGQTTIPIQAALQNWPQDGSRRIAKVELLVGGIVASTQELPADFAGTTFSFDWDVSQLNIVGSSTVILQVRAFDQFGISGVSSEVQLQIYPFVAPTATVETTTPGIIPPVSADCQDAGFSVRCFFQGLVRNLIWIVPLILFFILFIVLIILFNTNRKLAALTSPARNAISKGIEQVRKTLLGGTSVRRDALAYLHILAARPDRAGGKIEVYENRTTLGRDPNLTDVQLYNVDDETSVSGLHCTIFYDQGQFFITDDNSTNGTYLNGKRLAPNEPEILQDGAEIVLGTLARKGAKIRFQIATGFESSGGGYPSDEADFHYDLPVEGAPYSSPPAPRHSAPPPIDDSRKTVPGYRQDDPGEKTDIFHEPISPPPAPRPAPRVPPPQPNPPKPAPPPKKKGNDDWTKDLG